MVPSLRLALLALVPMLLALGVVLDETLLWPMLAADALLVFLMGVDILLGRRALVDVSRQVRTVFSIGRNNQVTLELRSRSKRQLRVQVTDDLFEDADAVGLPLEVDLLPGARQKVTYQLRPQRRGDYALGAHHVRYPTPLGLFMKQQRIAATDAVRVYPDVQAVRQFELLARQDRQSALLRRSRLRGGESEFERLRDFLVGDEYRKIDWRATARRQRLTARDYQIERNQNVFFVLDCGRLMTAETGGLSRLDHALNAVLMMSHVASRTGDHVGLLAFDREIQSYLPIQSATSGRERGSARVIRQTYDLHPRMVDSNFSAAFDEITRRVKKRSLVVLFTHVIDTRGADEMARMLRGLHPRHLPLVVLFRDEEVDRLLLAEDATTDLYTRAAAAQLDTWRQTLLRDLKQRGVLVLDTTHKQLTPKLVARYLDVKARQLL